MIDFYNHQDKNGIKELFEAYKNWEIRERNKVKTIEEITILAENNFDCISKLADNYIKSEDLLMSSILYAQSPANSGSINQFYREAINYQPLNPNIN